MTVSNAPDRSALLVPPRRLAELLVQRRLEMGQSVLDVERRALGRFSAGDLAMFESGETAPNDDDLRHLAAIYGVDLASITPQRAVLELDLTEGVVVIGAESERFAPSTDDREILLRYLAIVYRMRAINPGVVVPSRTDDLATLAAVFSTSPDEIRATLESLMIGDRIVLRRRHADLKRRVIVPGLGVLVALTTVGGLLLVRNSGGISRSPISPAPSAATLVDIGSALTIERAGGSAVSTEIGTSLTIERSGASSANVDIGTAMVIERGSSSTDIDTAHVTER